MTYWIFYLAPIVAMIGGVIVFFGAIDTAHEIAKREIDQ